MTNKDKENFFYPRSRYYGQVKPQDLVFNANLQEFTQRVSLICNLQTGGKMTPEEAYYQIKNLWKQLKLTKKGLEIGENSVGEEGE